MVGERRWDGAEAWAVLDRKQADGSSCVIHFVDVACMDDELRPVCGAWGDEVTWTTILAIMTCPDCALVVRGKQPDGFRAAASTRASSPPALTTAHGD